MGENRGYPGTQTAAASIASFLAAVAARPDRLPPDVVHAAKRILLNGLRASLAGQAEPLPARLIASEQRRLGWDGPGRVLFSDARLPVEEAVAVNIVQWTLVLIDDLDLPSGIHPGAPAACAALGSALDCGASGTQVLAAIIAGIEVQIAAARAASPEMLQERGFAPLAVIAPLGSVSATAVLARPSPEVTRSAIGIAAMSGCGVWEMGGTASSMFLSGHTTRMGVAAVRAAALGVDAPPQAFDGEFGAFRAYSGKAAAVLHEHLAGLGRTWLTPRVTLQPYSGDTYTQAPLECIRMIRGQAPESRHRGAVREIVVDVHERVALGVERKHRRHRHIDSPLLLNSDPQSRIASAWLRGRYSYSPAFAELVSDVEVAALRERVTFRVDETVPDMASASLTVVFADGTNERAAVDGFPGSARGELSDDTVSQWFRSAAEPVLGRPRTDRIIDTVWHLEDDGAIDVLASDVFVPSF